MRNIQIHHITYKINGESIIGQELNYLKWLIALCEKHHKEVHSDKRHLLNPKSYFKIHAEDFKALKHIKF